MPTPTSRPDRTGAATPVPARRLLLAIVLVAVNLRAALASLPPLVHTIQADLGLSAAGAGLLTTLPVLCMGAFAPVSQRVAHSIGREATVGVALFLLLLGLAMRLAGSVLPLLLLTTLLAGIGIALCATVLPGIVKEFFGHQPGIVTGVYLLAMMVGATAASALSVPLSHALGSWERSLAAWSALAVVGLLAWLPVVRAVNDHDDVDPSRETTTALPGVARRRGCSRAISRCSRSVSTASSPGSRRPTRTAGGPRATPVCCSACGASCSWCPASASRCSPTA